MAILTAADKDLYFPDVCQSGDALVGLMARAENFLQSAWGTDRMLERRSFTEYRDFGRMSDRCYDQPYHYGARGHLNYRHLWLSNFPVELADPAPVIRYKGRINQGFGRGALLEWQTLEPSAYELTVDGRLDLGMSLDIAALEVTYTAGYDFTQETPDTIALKIAAGLLLQRLARTDPDATKNQDLTLEPLHQYFQSVLLPVQRYRRRVGVG